MKNKIIYGLVVIGTVLGLSACSTPNENNNNTGINLSEDEIKKRSQISYYEIDSRLVELNFIDSSGNKIRCFQSDGISCFILEGAKK